MTGTKATKDFADRLTELIKNSGKSMRTLSQELDISVGALSNYQNDAGEAGINSLKRIADYFGVTTDYLLGRTEDKGDAISELDKKRKELIEDISYMEKVADRVKRMLTSCL